METKEIIKKWRGNKRYSLRLIEAMPESEFSFRPIEEMKTFKSQESHLTTWMRTHSRFVTGIILDKPSIKTKDEILRHFGEFFDKLLAYLETATSDDLAEIVDMWYGKVSKEYVLMTMDNHLAHHCGQMVVYLRLKGITPPSYIGR